MKKNSENSCNEVVAVSRIVKFSAPFAALLGGIGYAMALPPLNWSILVFVVLLPLFWSSYVFRWRWSFLCGWMWGLGWAFFSCRFLREIHPAVPWMLAPVLAVWPGVYGAVLSLLGRKIFGNKDFSTPWRLNWDPVKALLYLFSAAALFTVLEWTRCHLFVWNDFSVTLWKIPFLMQIARITGRYGASLVITFLNAVIFALFFTRKPYLSAGVLAVYPLLAALYGVYRINSTDEFKEPVVWRCALIQGNLPQQRIADARTVIDSIETYCNLTREIPAEQADTVIWPECAIPIALRMNHPLGGFFRYQIAALDRQILLGSLDYTKDGGMTNSALLIEPGCRIAGKYDKFHRVPFGEYVPFRSLLPESWIAAFDMGRDLTDGKKLEPLRVNDQVSAGTAVCYEGIFSYVSAGFVRNGANVLTAVSNDVWYPESSEPEQHLANAVMRCVETGLPMIRCGNNGGSGVVTSRGIFTDYIGSAAERPELLREKAAGVVEVTFERHPEITPAVRFENAIVYLLLLLLGAVCFFSGKKIKQGKAE